MNNKTRQDAYKQVKILRKQGLGWRKIHQRLKATGYTNISAGSVIHWIYYNGKPTLNEIKGNFSELTSEKAFVFGVVGPGDGFVSVNQIGLSVIDEDFALKFKRCVERVYGVKCKRYLQKKSGYGKFPRHRMILHSKQAMSDLMGYGVSLKEENWRVPEVIKKAEAKIKAAYIQGFSDSQGSVGKREIKLASKNVKGLKEIQKLLRDIGIRASIQKSGNTSIIAVQDRKSLESFYSKVGFCTKRKQRKLATTLRRYKFYGTPTTTVDQLMPRIQELRQKGYKQNDIAKTLNLNQSTINRRLEDD